MYPGMKIIRLASILVLLLAFGITIAVFPRLPEIIAIHWNAAGQADGYAPALWAAFTVPVVMVLTAALLHFIPGLDPLRQNVEKFRTWYDGFILFMLVFLLAVHSHVLLWNLGYEFSPNLTLPAGFGLLLIFVGFLLGKAERNWFIGIRTPWTLSSDAVWRRTHRLGQKLFIVAGLIAITGVLAPEYAVIILLLPVLLVTAILFTYSYLEYRKEEAHPSP